MNQPLLSDTQRILVRIAGDDAQVDLPPLSTIALEVARLAAADDDRGDSAVSLANLIRRDVGLASQVIRVANSAFNAPRSPIASLTQATARLGMNQIRNIAYAFALRTDLFSGRAGGSSAGAVALAALWRESVATACFAQEVARLKRRDVESAYLAGLMHRLGYAVLLWRVVRAPDGANIRTERLQDFAADGHEAHVGGRLVEAWHLPSTIAAAVAHWRTPEGTPAAQQPLLLQIAVARALSNLLDSEEDVPVEMSGIAPLWLDALNLYPDDVAQLLSRRAAVRSTVECYL